MLIVGMVSKVQVVSSSLTADKVATRSHTTAIDTRNGTDNNAPGTPQSHVQKIREMKIITGLRVKRRPNKIGVTKFASER